jgi:hypothetical protein
MRPLRAMRVIAAPILALTLTTVAGAAPPQTAPQSVQGVMDTIVDPSADALWEVAGTVVTAGRTVVRRPRTAKDWARARGLASRLALGSKRLQAARPVGQDGHWALADSSTPGIRTAEQIQADIARDPARFYAAARRLEQTAQEAVTAIDRRDVPGLLEAGARIDAACEACHAVYWYPRRPAIALPAPEVFAKSGFAP